MNMINSIIIEGTIVEAKKSNMTNTVRITAKSIRNYKGPDGNVLDEISYFDIDTYGNLADVCEKWAEKDRDIRVIGRLKQERWTDDSGKNCSKIIVIAEHIEFKPMKKDIEHI